jgi:L-lactate dehydrogenase (cytochrome)
VPVITTIEDLRVLAEKRVPRMFYDYADSGSWTESTYRANESDFQKIKLRQRVAVNMENRSDGDEDGRPGREDAGVRSRPSA